MLGDTSILLQSFSEPSPVSARLRTGLLTLTKAALDSPDVHWPVQNVSHVILLRPVKNLSYQDSGEVSVKIKA